MPDGEGCCGEAQEHQASQHKLDRHACPGCKCQSRSAAIKANSEPTTHTRMTLKITISLAVRSCSISVAYVRMLTRSLQAKPATLKFNASRTPPDKPRPCCGSRSIRPRWDYPGPRPE